MSQKGNVLLLVIFGVLALVLIGSGAYYLGKQSNSVQSNNQDYDALGIPSKVTPTPISLKPADSQYPAAGICANAPAGDIVVFDIKLYRDNVPQPRCQKVLSTQKLEIKNDTDQTLSFNLVQYNLTVAPGQSQTLDSTFGSFLQPGVHIYKLSPISGPELWLQP